MNAPACLPLLNASRRLTGRGPGRFLWVRANRTT